MRQIQEQAKQYCKWRKTYCVYVYYSFQCESGW